MRYEEMKPDDYKLAKEAAPIAYVPWGAHEWHGRQNPLGLDTLKAHCMCLEMCAEIGGVVFPGVYCGHGTMKPYAGFDSTLEFSAECVKLLATEYLEQLANEGFKVIMILMGHYGKPHVNAILDVVSEFNESQDSCVAWAIQDFALTSEEGYSADHGGCFETSYMMYFKPELVEISRLPDDRELTCETDGIMGGNPVTDASAKKGRDATNVFVKNASAKIFELLKAKS